jgi:hypothetical protein
MIGKKSAQAGRIKKVPSFYYYMHYIRLQQGALPCLLLALLSIEGQVVFVVFSAAVTRG